MSKTKFPDTWAIGIDLGGTKIEVAQVDTAGRILDSVLRPTAVEGGEQAVVRQLIEMVDELCERCSAYPPAGIGIGVAGQISENTGLVHFAPNLGWKNFGLGAKLSGLLSYLVVIINDVRAATYGEWLFGAGQSCEDLVCLFVGTGIGGGVVSGGVVLDGATNSAGELGHTTLQLGGPKCHCRNFGCFEALASGWAIERDARAQAVKDPGYAGSLLKKATGQDRDITAKMVVEAFEEGDPCSIEIIEGVKSALVGGLVSVVNAFNPQRIILGGGVMEGLENIIPELEQRVKSLALEVAADGFQLHPARLDNNAGVIGAAAYALKKFENLQHNQ